MQLYFKKYIDYLRSFSPAIIVGAQAVASPKNITRPLSAIFSNFPLMRHGFTAPFCPDLVVKLTADINQFLCLDTHPVNPVYHRAQLSQHNNLNLAQWLNQQPTLTKLVSEMTAIACSEILTEQGQIHPVLVKTFQLDMTHPAKVRESLVQSFVTEIILPTLQSAWLSDKKCNDDLLKLVNGAATLPADLVTEAFADELAQCGEEAFNYMTRHMGKILVDNIAATIHDFEIYGRPLTLDFNHKDYLTHIIISGNSALNDLPCATAMAFPPFPAATINDMVEYFHREVIVTSIFYADLIVNPAINKLVTKIIFFAYSQLLSSNGDIKAEIVNQTRVNNRQPNRQQLVEAYIRKFFITLLTEWLRKFKFEFTQLNTSADYIDNILTQIESLLAKGISMETLYILNGFPTYANPLMVNRFCMPLPGFSAGNHSLKFAYAETIAKTALMLNARACFDDFDDMHIYEMDCWDEIQDAIQKLGASISHTQWQDEWAALNAAAEKLDEQAARLEEQLQEIDLVYLYESTASLQAKIHKLENAQQECLTHIRDGINKSKTLQAGFLININALGLDNKTPANSTQKNLRLN